MSIVSQSSQFCLGGVWYAVEVCWSGDFPLTYLVGSEFKRGLGVDARLVLFTGKR